MPETVTLSSQSPEKKRRPRFEVRKQEILDAAGALFNEHGLRDATLSVVASEIGLN